MVSTLNCKRWCFKNIKICISVQAKCMLKIEARNEPFQLTLSQWDFGFDLHLSDTVTVDMHQICNVGLIKVLREGKRWLSRWSVAALGNLGSVPSPHTGTQFPAPTRWLSSSYRASNVFFWPPWAPGTQLVHRHKCEHNIYIQIKIKLNHCLLNLKKM